MYLTSKIMCTTSQLWILIFGSMFSSAFMTFLLVLLFALIYFDIHQVNHAGNRKKWSYFCWQRTCKRVILSFPSFIDEIRTEWSVIWHNQHLWQEWTFNGKVKTHILSSFILCAVCFLLDILCGKNRPFQFLSKFHYRSIYQ